MRYEMVDEGSFERLHKALDKALESQKRLNAQVEELSEKLRDARREICLWIVRAAPTRRDGSKPTYKETADFWWPEDNLFPEEE